jgi:hypothetical protein
MNILTSDNKPYSMDDVGKQLNNKVDFCVLDYTDTKNPDFFFVPLIFMETFNKPSITLKIGQYHIQMPMDWSIVVGDIDRSELEIIQLSQLNDRDFQAFVMNPINGYMPAFHDIQVVDYAPDVIWNIPKLKYGYILTVPINNGFKSQDRIHPPSCCFFVKDTVKIPDTLDLNSILV